MDQVVLDETMCRFVTISRFNTLTGYTEDAVRAKIARGQWLMDVMWRKAPDGRILMDMQAFERWVLGELIVHTPPRARKA